MPEAIIDGSGKGFQAKVDSSNRLTTAATTATAIEHAGIEGDSYNINTGKINLTGASASAVVYIKNNGERDLDIENVAIGVSDGTVSDIGELILVRNPTGGDIISDGTAVDMNQNRNFGSPKTLTVDVYKGKDGGTLSGGNDYALFFQGDNTRLFTDLDTILPRGTSLGITYNPKLSSGSVNVYVALILHLVEV